MATGESDGPRGLNMSLDQIIAENNKSKKLQPKNGHKVQHNGRSNHFHQSSRGRGRGGIGKSSAGGGQAFGRGGRGQQQYALNHAEPERIVLVEEPLPNLEYRQVCCAYRCSCIPSTYCLLKWNQASFVLPAVSRLLSR